MTVVDIKAHIHARLCDNTQVAAIKKLAEIHDGEVFKLLALIAKVRICIHVLLCFRSYSEYATACVFKYQ